MAAIFPPANKGGIPPGVNVVNGYTPDNHVVGEGPLYVASDCTTALTSDQMNGLTSEILAAVDKLGIPYNSSQVDNLGLALVQVFGTKVNVSGDTMTGPLNVVYPPTDPANATSKRYVDEQIAAEAAFAELEFVNISGDTMTGPLTLSGNPSQPLHPVTLAYGDTAYVNVTGDIMTGALVLYGDPVAPMQAVPLEYADKTYLFKAGDTMTGPLVLPADPTLATQAATKNYVDQKFASETATAICSATSPGIGAADGSIWFNTINGCLYVRYNDGNSTQWVMAPGLAIYSTTSTRLAELEERMNAVEGNSQPKKG